MQESQPSVSREDCPDGAIAAARGRWTAAQLAIPGIWAEVARQLSALPPGAGWNLEAIDVLDHVGAQALWNHWGHAWPDRVVLSPEQRRMLERVAGLSASPPVQEKEAGLSQHVDALGVRVIEALLHMRDMVRMVGQLLLDFLRLLRAPHEGPWRDVSGHLYQMGATALPITALVGFLIGVVLAYLMALQLRQFGAESFIVNILGISLIRELGPLLAAILVAGRSGSSITAQIGVMRVTEELDAMRVMGIAHGFRLVMPRALALALGMPLVSVWTTLAALAGGMLAADISLNISPSYFVNALPAAVEFSNLTVAVLKSVVFGTMIALVGCHFGLRVEPDTQSLGRGTTASVVTSITMVIVIDALFAVAFKNIGMGM
jgi:phospholipid/cholesterol/gamma-HCH transport system permease protein